MWSAERALSSLITNVLVHKKFEQFVTLQDELNNKFAHFVDVLKDAPPQLQERERVKRAAAAGVEGIKLNAGQQQQLPKKLTATMVEEALTLSDLFGLSEIGAVELLVEAEEQMQFFHGFNRGLTAVLLYYDTKKVAVNSLKAILLARSGRTWLLDENMPAEIVKFIDDYVDRLIHNGLVAKLLAQIGSNEWQKAEESLNRVNGLGNLKHRKQVKNLFYEVKVTMAECIFDCACQVPFTLKDTLSMIQFLKTNCHLISSPSSSSSTTSLSATTTTAINTSGQLVVSRPSSASIETSHLYLIMALLYSFECSYLENKEKVEIDKIMDLYLKEPDYIKTIYKELTKSDDSEWTTIGVKAVLQFSYQIFLNILNGHIIDNDFSLDLQWIATGLNGLEEDETLIDNAIQLHVFAFIKNVLIQHEKFHLEVTNQFCIRI